MSCLHTLLLCGLSLAHARFLYKQEPLVRVSPAVGDSDLFGYAVAFHRVDDTGDPNDFDHAISNTIILVGAPTGTFPGGLNFPGINDSSVVNRTGLVYACPITPGECRSVSGSGVGNDIRLFDYKPNTVDRVFDMQDIILPSEEKDGQFLGATILSTGELVIVCAPRWISLLVTNDGPYDKTRAHGRCFYSGQNLTNFQQLRPCTGGESQSPIGEAYCMAGTAATAYETNSSNFEVFLAGPPFSEGTGAIFHYDISNGVPGDADRIVPSPSPTFFYGGLSVTVGHIFSTYENDLIYSLPKKNFYKGTVQVYNISDDMVQAEVSGTQMGEYFGWAVATADLDGDSYDEVIVGAPLFSTPTQIEKGRIFIFKLNATGSLDAENPIVIQGTENKGRYGSAIVNLGDINNDGFEDIAVSAPFAKQEDGAEGIVYIYLGSGETVINEEPEDTITASEISKTVGLDSSNTLKSFGYSLSSGVDVDANFYDDLVIGGYESQAVVVLRARSVVAVTYSLSTFPADILNISMQNCSVNSVNFSCFDMLINASFSGCGRLKRFETRFDVTEVVVDGKPRLFFVDSVGNRMDVYRGTFNFTDRMVQEKTIKVYVENDLQERRRNLNLTVNIYSPTEDQEPREVNGSQNIIDLREIPILEVLPRNNMNQELSLSGCRNLTCQPDLELTLKEVRYLDSTCGDSGDERVQDEFVAGGVECVEFVLNYRTLDDHAIETFLTVDLTSNLLQGPENIISNPPGQLPTTQCPFDKEDGVYKCDLKTVYSDFDGELEVTIQIPVRDAIIGNEPDEIIRFTITKELENDPNITNNNVEVDLSVSTRASVTFDKLTVSPERAQYDDTGGLGQRIRATISLSNAGPTTIPLGELTVYLPGRAGEFYYLYPINTPSTMHCSGLDPDDLQDSSRRRRSPGTLERLYRMVSEEKEPKRIQKRAIAKTVDCKQETESCTEIVCNITDFNREMSIAITSQVDNRFFRSESGDFEFYAYATFRILTFKGEERDIRSNRFVVEEKQQEQDKQVPIWVYIVSSVAALIVLALIVLLLYLIGFFRLRQRERMAKERERRNSVAATSRHGGYKSIKENDEDTKDEDTKDDDLEKNNDVKPVDIGEETKGEEDNELDEKPPTDSPNEATGPDETQL